MLPNVGIEMETPFRVDCIQWKDGGNEQVGGFLIYFLLGLIEIPAHDGFQEVVPIVWGPRECRSRV